MKNDTKKIIVTVINIVIFVGNAIISALSSGDAGSVAMISSAGLSIMALA